MGQLKIVVLSALQRVDYSYQNGNFYKMPLTDYTRHDKNLISSDNRMLMLIDIELPCITHTSAGLVYYELFLETYPLFDNERVSVVGPCSLKKGTMFVFINKTTQEVSLDIYQVKYDTVPRETRTDIRFIPPVRERYTRDTHQIFVFSSGTVGTIESYSIRIARDNVDFKWNNKTWHASDFDIDEILETSKGEIPRLDLRISNINRLMEYYLQQYDYFLKTNLFKPVYATIYVVNSYFQNSYDPDSYELRFKFELKQPKTTDKVATFTLGATSPYTHRFPTCRMFRNQCKVRKYGDNECGAATSEAYPTCDRQLASCKLHNNEIRFGGFPSLNSQAIKL
jgi:phage-related protein